MGRSSTISMDDNIQFSVIICTHNRANILDRVLNSVLEISQDHFRYEVIVVANSCTDETIDVVQPYLKNGLVRYIEEPVLGLSRARNRAWQNAKGKYVVFLDDDGEVTKDWLNGFKEIFEEHRNAAACGGRIIPKYETLKPAWISGIIERFYGHYDLGHEVTICDWVPGGNSAWRKNIVQSLGGFDIRFGRKGQLVGVGGEESQLIYRALKQGLTLYYTPKALMYHHIPKDRMYIGFICKRWFGQGVTDFRYLAVRENFSKKEALRYCVNKAVEVIKTTARIIKSLIPLRKYQTIHLFFEFMNRSGHCLEALRYTLRCKT